MKMHYLIKTAFLLLSVMYTTTVCAQKKSKSSNEQSEVSSNFTEVMSKYEDSLVIYADSIRHGIIPSEKAHYNEKLVLTLRRALAVTNSYSYKFDRLKEYMHIVESDDKKFRIFNWVVIVSEFQRRYYGAIQMNQPELVLYPLFDRSEELEKEGRAFDVVTNKEWYGGEIYNIMKVNTTTEKKEPVYAIFTYNNNAVYSKKKILDHLVFTDNGPQFGLPIIYTPQGILARMIIEYKKEAFVNLNYNKDEKKIIFDRLVSDIGDPSKRFTYIPTGQLDGLEFKNGAWHFVPDAIPVLKLNDGEAPINGVFRK